MKTKVFYSDKYYIDIGEHVFPTAKYRLIKEKLLSDPAIANKICFVEPEKPADRDLARAHTEAYLDKLKRGRLSPGEILTLELPYSKELAEGSALCCGGTIGAVEAALDDGLGVHLGGGFHHAFPDHGEGFCVLNDIAVAIKKGESAGRIKKVLVIDCDLPHPVSAHHHDQYRRVAGHAPPRAWAWLGCGDARSHGHRLDRGAGRLDTSVTIRDPLRVHDLRRLRWTPSGEVSFYLTNTSTP